MSVEPDVEVLARFAGGSFPDGPAVTTRGAGAGRASYVATSPDAAGLAALLAEFARLSGIGSRLDVAAHGSVEIAARRTADAEYLFYINHEESPVTLTGVDGTDLLGAAIVDGHLELGPNGVAVVRASLATTGTVTA
jgi:beta-galactosidase